MQPYDRYLYPHWGPSPEPGYDDVRQYMIAQAVVTGLKVDDGKVVAGTWYCFYTGKLYDIKHVVPDLDHIVPLKAAHIRGGHAWDRQKRKDFANDPINLVVVLAGSNRQKSALLGKWLPPNIANGTVYIKLVLAVLAKYKDLQPTHSDRQAHSFLSKKLQKWKNGIRLDPVKEWFEKTFKIDINYD